MVSLRDSILQAGAGGLPREVVRVPEWGCAVEVRALSALTQGEYEDAVRAWVESGESVSTVRALCALLVRTCYDTATGKPIFRLDDVDELAAMSTVSVLQRVADVAQRLSSVTNEDVEALAGKSVATLSAGSG